MKVCHLLHVSLTCFYALVSHKTYLSFAISQLPNLFIGTLRICNFILLLIVWVHSFSKILPSVKFVEDKVLVFIILRDATLTLTIMLTLISRED